MSEGICWLLELDSCVMQDFSFDISMVLKWLTTLQTQNTNQTTEFKQCDGFLFT